MSYGLNNNITTKDKMIEIGKVDQKTLSVDQANQLMMLFDQPTIFAVDDFLSTDDVFILLLTI